MYSRIPAAQATTIARRCSIACRRRKLATNMPKEKIQASARAIAASDQTMPLQTPRLGNSQMPRRQRARPIGSRNPVESTKTLVGASAAKAAAATATRVPQ